jgi:hypothetical protein
MDPFRQIRIIFGPSVLFFSLLVGAWSNGTRVPDNSITTIVAIAAAAIVPAGFAIGGLTTLILNGLWLIISRKNHYQAHVSEAAWENIFLSLSTAPKPDLKNDSGCHVRLLRLYAAATFVRIRMDKQIHELLERRYQAFTAFVNGCVALGLSLVVGWVIGIEVTCKWTWITVSLFLLFSIVAGVTWREMMKLLECAALTTNERDRFPHKEL